MAITNYDRVGNAFNLLQSELGPFVEREINGATKDNSPVSASQIFANDRHFRDGKPIAQWDAAMLLKVMCESWDQIFHNTLGKAERRLVEELREHRNRWAHERSFSNDDAYRAIDSAARLLTAVSAPQSHALECIKKELEASKNLASRGGT